MYYLDFLQALHHRLAPRTYMEVGVAQGHSLSLSSCRSIGVDPGFVVDQELRAPTSLFRMTSDDYFASLNGSPFGDLPIDLAYIDGMHHFENALRDFINIESRCARTSAIAFDDILPRSVEEAARERQTQAWTGDVFRIVTALRRHRRDLKLIRVDTEPTGTLLVTSLNPADRALAEAMDDIVRDFVQPDPQPVPVGVLQRRGTVKAEKVLALPLWDELRQAREPVPVVDRPAPARKRPGAVRRR